MAAEIACRDCERLVAWREEVARNRRASFIDQTYWGRPVPGWGDPAAHLLILGLAPAAHGGNRTGRIFTGDRSGDYLFAALHRAGIAAIATSESSDDGQTLTGAWMSAAVRCAPPANKPTPVERDTCRPFLVRELQLLAPTLRSVLVLGGFAWQALWPAWREAGRQVPQPLPRFGHGVVTENDGVRVVGSYHPSQQNTFTGRLTHAMLDDVIALALAPGRLDGR